MRKRLNMLTRVLLAGGVLLATSCSTQKATWQNIQYHNTTAHYNVWWNGNESLKKGVEMIETRCKDDYTRILPVVKLGTKEECMAMSPQFDRAVEKSILAIKKHSIMVDGHEYVPYIAQCYLMTAYATFYKHDYVTASSTCLMLMSQYHGTAVGDEATILKARCNALDGRWQDAESDLDELVAAVGKDNFAPAQRLNLYLAMAECTVPQEKYKKAVQFLKLALDEHPSQRQKARICFILGQIYQANDKRPTASKYYEMALRHSPSYEMEFNARLNMASCADLQHTDRQKLERLLDKMAKDKKNEEFLDQIYYAKGEMYVGMKDLKSACEAFRKSSAVSTNNAAQKARSALRLADIQYERFQNYDMAQVYYDTAMGLIRKDYPHYSDIKSRYDLLTSLVSYTRVIEHNDSLMAVAAMPEADRMQLIQKKIEEVKKAEEEAKERELLQQLANDNKAQTNSLKGDWYFYNASTVQKGKETFRQRWGMRTLEDYWFLSKKGLLGMNMLIQNVEADTADTDTIAVDKADTAAKADTDSGNPDDPHSVAYYLKSLPTSQADLDSMHADISVGLLNAGYIYYDGIGNIPRALECYLRMANNYTTSPEIVQAFYMLYKIYDKQGNTPNANYYRDMVLMGFPDSDFANLILDEDYYKEIMRRSQLIKEDYEEIYTLYRRHRYDDVIAASYNASQLYEGNPMLGKFAYWEGLAYAHTDRKDAAIRTFRAIIDKYPARDTIVPLAQAQLDYLMGEGGRDIASLGGEELPPDADTVATTKRTPYTKPYVGKETSDELSPEAQLFRYRPDQPHFVIILVNDKKIRATQLHTKMGTFILTYYANSGYKTSPLMFTDSTQMITFSTFKSATEAYDFATHLMRPESPLAEYDATDYQVFAISKQNYTTLYNRKKVDAYKQFYDKNYTK